MDMQPNQWDLIEEYVAKSEAAFDDFCYLEIDKEICEDAESFESIKEFSI